LVIVVALAGCSGEDPVMPDVTGQKLDAAQTAIQDAGFDDDVEVDGGGLFGVIEEANWVVCEQSPAAGGPLTEAPHLVVDRSCGEDEEPTEEPTEESTEEPSETETPREPEVITARDNKDFAALLGLGDYCDGSIKTFANEYAGRTIQFDGAIVNMMNHGSHDTRYDVLLSPGDFDPNSAQGPSFKYQDVSVFDLELTGKKIPNRIGVGDEFTFTAEVVEYSANQCLFYLDPVSTEIRQR
jgi:Domain of unknown function (DUF4839)/PASTA domain